MRKSKNLPAIDVKKYGGKQVAFLDGRIVASGRTLSSVIRQAKKRVPSRPLSEFTVFSVPKSLSAIYYA